MIDGRGGVFVYNNDRKQAFIEKESELRKLENIEKRCVWGFRRVEPYEDKYNKDVSEFSYEEIMEMYKDIKIGLAGTLNLHGLLRKYTSDLSISNNAYLAITQTELKNFFVDEKKTILTYDDVTELVDSLINPMDKFFIYGLFCGVKGEQYCELNYSTMDHANYEEGYLWLAKIEESENINIKGRKFFADKKLFDFAKEASEATYYIQCTKEGIYKRVLLEFQTKKIYKLPYSPLDQVVKPENERRRINQKLKNLMNSMGVNDIITPLDIYWSGMIYTIQKKALQKGKTLTGIREYLDFFEEDGFEDVQEQYNIELNKRYLKSRIERYL